MKKALASISSPLPSPDTQGKYPLCGCTKEGAEAAPSKITSVSDTTSTNSHTVGADTIYSGLSLNTVWLGDTTIYFDPITLN